MAADATDQLTAEVESDALAEPTYQLTPDMMEQPTIDRTEELTAGTSARPSSDVSYDIAWDQIQGRRKAQQDCAVCIPMDVSQHLLVLADGMGGHTAGDVASSVAVTSFCGAFEAPGMPEDLNERLKAALEVANYAMHDRVAAAPELAGMGTTLVAAMVEGRELRWLSVGDSPLWLIRDRAIRRLNANHSVAGELAERVATGEMTAAEADLAPGRSLLLSALQGGDIDLVDIPEAPVRLEPGDVVIVASDGVETCSLDELIALVGAEDSAEDMVSRTLAEIEENQRVYQDNATLIVCCFPSSEYPVASE